MGDIEGPVNVLMKFWDLKYVISTLCSGDLKKEGDNFYYYYF